METPGAPDATYATSKEIDAEYAIRFHAARGFLGAFALG